MSVKKKYLIVGQGLAGSILALKMKERDISFDIVDNGWKSSSSTVAVGIMHCMSFKRLILAWKAPELIKYASSFYEDLETKWNLSFYDHIPFYRPIASADEYKIWEQRVNDEEYKDHLYLHTKFDLGGINCEHGVGEIKGGGRLKVAHFLKNAKETLLPHYVKGVFKYSDLKSNESNISFNGNSYSDIIFSEGHQFVNNPYFNYLPHNCTKGEVISIEASGLNQKWVSRGCFLLPHSDNKDLYSVGSTYRWHTFDASTTEEGKDELIKKVEKLGDVQVKKVVEHKGGIRPTINDRRPLLGTHPIFKNIHLFNGMGSKAVMIAPYYADQFVNYLSGEVNLDSEVDIYRWKKQQKLKFGFHEAEKMS